MEALNLPSRGNLVAVISNGTAALRLGNIGAVAGKPVMEGKACLFKKFAGVDVFDIEIDETDPNRLVAPAATVRGITNMTALAAVAGGARPQARRRTSRHSRTHSARCGATGARPYRNRRNTP